MIQYMISTSQPDSNKINGVEVTREGYLMASHQLQTLHAQKRKEKNKK